LGPDLDFEGLRMDYPLYRSREFELWIFINPPFDMAD